MIIRSCHSRNRFSAISKLSHHDSAWSWTKNTGAIISSTSSVIFRDSVRVSDRCFLRKCPAPRQLQSTPVAHSYKTKEKSKYDIFHQAVRALSGLHVVPEAASLLVQAAAFRPVFGSVRHQP